MATKTKKISPAEQGIPAVYLKDDGSAFKVGLDARLKSDLIAVILNRPHKGALHKFTPEEAQAIIEKRGWESNLAKSKIAWEREQARAAARKAEKAEKTRAAVAAKKETTSETTDNGEVKPDPKPVRRAKS